jgi:hypothetical protein
MSIDNKISEFPRQPNGIILDDVIQSITDWRATKNNRNVPIPEEIWKNIFILFGKFSEQTLCAALGITNLQFQRKLEEQKFASKVPSQPSELPRMDFCEARQPSPPVYKPARIPATNTLVVEFCRSDGRIMKIHTTTDSFAELMKAFFGGG